MRRVWRSCWAPVALVVLAMAVASCGDDGTEADRLGVGAECTKAEDCRSGQQCLAFRGGYCGVQACSNDTGCPAGSACVVHSDGMNYCFRVCADKAECNRNRTASNESNCSANISFTDPLKDRKACVPPGSN